MHQNSCPISDWLPCAFLHAYWVPHNPGLISDWLPLHSYAYRVPHNLCLVSYNYPSAIFYIQSGCLIIRALSAIFSNSYIHTWCLIISSWSAVITWTGHEIWYGLYVYNILRGVQRNSKEGGGETVGGWILLKIKSFFCEILNKMSLTK